MSSPGNERWRLVLSDGQHFAQSMLATQQNGMITSGELRELCIVTLTNYIVNVVQSKRRASQSFNHSNEKQRQRCICIAGSIQYSRQAWLGQWRQAVTAVDQIGATVGTGMPQLQ